MISCFSKEIPIQYKWLNICTLEMSRHLFTSLLFTFNFFVILFFICRLTSCLNFSCLFFLFFKFFYAMLSLFLLLMSCIVLFLSILSFLSSNGSRQLWKPIHAANISVHFSANPTYRNICLHLPCSSPG